MITLIDGVQYKKLLTAKDSLSANWKVDGYIRENVAEQKVYYKPENSPEILLYTFNVQISDVLETFDYKLRGEYATVYSEGY